MNSAKRLSGMFATALVTSLIFSSLALAAPRPAIHVIVNGSTVTFPDGKPFADAEGRVQVPISILAKSLGAKVSWNASTKTVQFTRGSTTVTMKVGQRQYSVNNAIKKMDTAATVSNGRVYAPAKYISNALGASVNWNNVTNTMTLSNDAVTAGAGASAGTSTGTGVIPATGTTPLKIGSTSDLKQIAKDLSPYAVQLAALNGAYHAGDSAAVSKFTEFVNKNVSGEQNKQSAIQSYSLRQVGQLASLSADQLKNVGKAMSGFESLYGTSTVLPDKSLIVNFSYSITVDKDKFDFNIQLQFTPDGSESLVLTGIYMN